MLGHARQGAWLLRGPPKRQGMVVRVSGLSVGCDGVTPYPRPLCPYIDLRGAEGWQQARRLNKAMSPPFIRSTIVIECPH